MAIEFTSHGGTASLKRQVLGTYVLQNAKMWINNRVVYYSSQTGQYLFWMNTLSTKIKGERGFWLVRITNYVHLHFMLNSSHNILKHYINL